MTSGRRRGEKKIGAIPTKGRLEEIDLAAVVATFPSFTIHPAMLPQVSNKAHWFTLSTCHPDTHCTIEQKWPFGTFIFYLLLWKKSEINVGFTSKAHLTIDPSLHMESHKVSGFFWVAISGRAHGTGCYKDETYSVLLEVDTINFVHRIHEGYVNLYQIPLFHQVI